MTNKIEYGRLSEKKSDPRLRASWRDEDERKRRSVIMAATGDCDESVLGGWAWRMRDYGGARS